MHGVIVLGFSAALGGLDGDDVDSRAAVDVTEDAAVDVGIHVLILVATTREVVPATGNPTAGWWSFCITSDSRAPPLANADVTGRVTEESDDSPINQYDIDIEGEKE